MNITWDDLIIPFEASREADLVATWLWLIGDDKRSILITSVGDMFLQGEAGQVFWLDAGGGVLTQVADSVEAFKALLNDEATVREWFLVEVVAALKREGLHLAPGKLYGYKTLPVLGGEYSPENFELTDVEVHFHLAGQIHEQIKDLPDGTEISGVTMKD